MSNETQQSAAPTESATQTSGTGISFEERSAAAFDALGDGVPAEQQADAAPVAPAPPAEDKLAAERRERLAKLAAEERSKVDAKARMREQDQLRARLEAAERKAAEAERIAQQRIDITALNEEQFFEYAQRANVTPQRLGEWIRERMANPEIAAAQAARKVLDPEVASLREELAALKAAREADLREREAYQAQVQEQRAAQEFFEFTASNSESAPRSAAFLREFGPQEFHKVALAAAARVPPGGGAQAVLDQIEENLSMLARIYSAGQAVSTAKPSVPPTNPAAARAPTTVSNTLAQTRASVVDEEAEWASLPFEERSARLFR